MCKECKVYIGYKRIVCITKKEIPKEHHQQRKDAKVYVLDDGTFVRYTSVDEFNYVCDEEKIERENRAKTYIAILKHYHFTFPKANSQLNTEARLQAGFSLQELQMLENIVFTSKNPK